MCRNLEFILRSIIIYVILGFSFCTANEKAITHAYWGNIVVVIGFICVLDRLIRYDKQKNIKIFKTINIAYLFPIITLVAVILYDFFNKIYIE